MLGWLRNWHYRIYFLFQLLRRPKTSPFLFPLPFPSPLFSSLRLFKHVFMWEREKERERERERRRVFLSVLDLGFTLFCSVELSGLNFFVPRSLSEIFRIASKKHNSNFGSILSFSLVQLSHRFSFITDFTLPFLSLSTILLEFFFSFFFRIEKRPPHILYPPTLKQKIEREKEEDAKWIPVTFHSLFGLFFTEEYSSSFPPPSSRSSLSFSILLAVF